MTCAVCGSTLRRLAAVAVWGLSGAACVLSVGLCLADLLPASVPAPTAACITFATAAANALGLWLWSTTNKLSEPHQRLQVSLASLAGPALAGFAWIDAPSPGLWLSVLGLLACGVTGAICWSLADLAQPLSARLSLSLESSQTEETTRSIKAGVRTPSTGDSASSPASEPVLSARGVQPHSPAPDDAGPESTVAGAISGHATAPGVAIPEGDVCQQIVRRRTVEGETIEIVATVEFAAGELQAVLHLPISPPLPAAPDVECEPLEDDDLELRVGAAYPYGIRIDARRETPADHPVRASIGILLKTGHGRVAA